jgi:serine O-acetyltransferase
MSIYERLVYARKSRLLGKLAYFLLKLMGVEIPVSVDIGPGFLLHHGGAGVVIHPKAVLGARVGIYPGVTLGRADVYRAAYESAFEGLVVEDDVILGAGAKILCDEGILRVRRGTVVGANAVLTESTGEYEIWAGIPARKVGERDRR